MHREGNARMTIFAASSNARTFDYQAGDIGYVPAGFGTSPELSIEQYVRCAYPFLLWCRSLR
jgi:hypothetical protein